MKQTLFKSNITQAEVIDRARTKHLNFVECGSCGHYHLEDYFGDCREDGERFTIDDIPDEFHDGIIDLCLNN